MQFVGQPEKRNRPMKKKRAAMQLVFLDDSPDYCETNMQQGTVGTKGRHCS